MMRFFTSDWHLNSSNIIKYAQRPFKNAERMAHAYITSCNQQAKSRFDQVIHVGDFFLRGADRHDSLTGEDHSLGFSAEHYLEQITASVILLEGNHDKSNIGHTLAKQLILDLGPFKCTSVSHYPSTDKGTWTLKGKDKEHLHIHLCGHVHDKWKWKLDFEKLVLNINVGVDQWKHQIVSEKKLIGFISSLLASEELKSQLNARPMKLHRPSVWSDDPAEEVWTSKQTAEKW